jgi:putative nucleotidyltransferase-like protein
MSLVTNLNRKKRKGLPPERELLLLCARTRVDDAAARRLRVLLRGKLNWPEIVNLACEHHVAPFLYEHLKLAGEGLVPAQCLDQLRQRARESSGLALVLVAELLRIQKLFEAEPALLIPFKGPVLGWLAYGTLTRRTFIDLDFVLPQEQVVRATALLESAGYRADSSSREDVASQAGYAPGQYAFVREETRAQVELHTERTLRYFPTPLDLDKVSGRFITVEIAGMKMRTFSVEDTLVMVCVHGNKHFWDRLAWIADVAELIAAQPVDWALTLQIAAEMKSTRVLLLGLFLANDMLGAALPELILEKIRRDSAVRRLASRVLEQFNGNTNAQRGILRRALFRLRSRDGIAQGVRHMVRLTLAPTERDHGAIRLPRALGFLYAIVRPWRLLKEYGLGLLHRKSVRWSDSQGD